MSGYNYFIWFGFIDNEDFYVGIQGTDEKVLPADLINGLTLRGEEGRIFPDGELSAVYDLSWPLIDRREAGLACEDDALFILAGFTDFDWRGYLDEIVKLTQDAQDILVSSKAK